MNTKLQSPEFMLPPQFTGGLSLEERLDKIGEKLEMVDNKIEEKKQHWQYEYVDVVFRVEETKLHRFFELLEVAKAEAGEEKIQFISARLDHEQL